MSSNECVRYMSFIGASIVSNVVYAPFAIFTHVLDSYKSSLRLFSVNVFFFFFEEREKKHSLKTKRI